MNTKISVDVLIRIIKLLSDTTWPRPQTPRTRSVILIRQYEGIGLKEAWLFVREFIQTYPDMVSYQAIAYEKSVEERTPLHGHDEAHTPREKSTA